MKWRVVTGCFYFSVHPSANLHSNRVLKRSTLVDVTREVEDGANRQEPGIWSRPWESDFPTSPRYFHHKGLTVTVILLGGCELKNWNSNSLTPKIQRIPTQNRCLPCLHPPQNLHVAVSRMEPPKKLMDFGGLRNSPHFDIRGDIWRLGSYIQSTVSLIEKG